MYSSAYQCHLFWAAFHYFTLKKNYLQNIIYLHGSFHYYIQTLQQFLSHEKVLTNPRILEKAAMLGYSLPTQIKAAGTGDHWSLLGVPLGTTTCKRAECVTYSQNFFSASLFTYHHWRMVTLLTNPMPLNKMKLCLPLLCSQQKLVERQHCCQWTGNFTW